MSERPAPGRDQLVAAALTIIGERGLKAATVAAVAEAADVTPGLVVHHFGTKANLAAEVERMVLDRFNAALIGTDDVRPTQAAESISQRLSEVIGADPVLRRYVRRAVLEASPTGQEIISRLVELTTDALQRFEHDIALPTGRQRTWLAVQIVTINLAATLLEPVLPTVLGHDPFTKNAVRERTSANLRFLTAAITNLDIDPSDAR